MANVELLIKKEDAVVLHSSSRKGESNKSRGQSIEKKIDVLESLAGTVSNRRSRRWLNDRILIELVPRLNVEEIRGLFAPPPWGENAPLSVFCMTNAGEWDPFRSIDMDKEEIMIEEMEASTTTKKKENATDRMVALKAWKGVDSRAREALRRNFHSDLITGYDQCLRAFIKDNRDEDVLILHVQDPYQRLLLHGACEFYDLVSVTFSTLKDNIDWKTTKIRKKPSCKHTFPNIPLAQFLRMVKAVS